MVFTRYGPDGEEMFREEETSPYTAQKVEQTLRAQHMAEATGAQRCSINTEQ